MLTALGEDGGQMGGGGGGGGENCEEKAPVKGVRRLVGD